MATTAGNVNYPSNTNRNNAAIYWGIGIAVVLAAILFFAFRGNREAVTTNPAATAPAVTEPAARTTTNNGAAAQMDGAQGTETTPTGTNGAGQNSPSTTTTSDVPGNH